MSWGTRRRNFILLIVFILIAIPSGIFLFNTFYEAPTCFDAKQNGDETGVDCGGSCELVCEQVARDAVVLWNRFFAISPGNYNVIAMIENPNLDAGAENVPYRFRLYDKDSILLTEREGIANIPPRATFPIVEIGLPTGKLTPQRIDFEFTGEFDWNKKEPADPVLVIRDQKILNEDTEPRINALMQNISIRTIQDIDVVVVVYDNRGNAIGSSGTFIQRIDKDQLVNLTFTWSQPFERDVAKIEIIPLYEAN